MLLQQEFGTNILRKSYIRGVSCSFVDSFWCANSGLQVYCLRGLNCSNGAATVPFRGSTASIAMIGRIVVLPPAYRAHCVASLGACHLLCSLQWFRPQEAIIPQGACPASVLPPGAWLHPEAFAPPLLRFPTSIIFAAWIPNLLPPWKPHHPQPPNWPLQISPQYCAHLHIPTHTQRGGSLGIKVC